MARCPVRPGESCTLCNPGATGPGDCPTVYAVMTDPDLRSRLAELRRAERAERTERADRPESVEQRLTGERPSAPR